jgi:hypothetical protein
MKKILFLIMALGVVMTACKKDDAIPLEDNPGEFEITPSKGSDWAGGYVTFDASHSVRYMTYDALTEGVEADRNFSTKLENNTLTLGLYKDAEGNIADCDILIRATDYDGNETSCTVRSKAWKPAVYTKIMAHIQNTTSLKDGQEVPSVGWVR